MHTMSCTWCCPSTSAIFVITERFDQKSTQRSSCHLLFAVFLCSLFARFARPVLVGTWCSTTRARTTLVAQWRHVDWHVSSFLQNHEKRTIAVKASFTTSLASAFGRVQWKISLSSLFKMRVFRAKSMSKNSIEVFLFAPTQIFERSVMEVKVGRLCLCRIYRTCYTPAIVAVSTFSRKYMCTLLCIYVYRRI